MPSLRTASTTSQQGGVSDTVPLSRGNSRMDCQMTDIELEIARQKQTVDASVKMISDGIKALPTAAVVNVMITLIESARRFTSSELEQLSKRAGREAHSRARQRK